MVKQKRVCLMGAGVSGLAAAKAFLARGHHVAVVERSGDLGGVWEPARSSQSADPEPEGPLPLHRQGDADVVSGMAERAAGLRLSRRLRPRLRDQSLDPLQYRSSANQPPSRLEAGLENGSPRS